MTRTFQRTALLLLAAFTAGCGGHLGDLRGPVGPGDPPILPPSAIPQAGLAAMAAGDGVVRVDYVLPGDAFEAALFMSLNRNTVFDGQPVEAPLDGTPTGPEPDATVRGTVMLTATSHPALVINDTPLFAGFAIRAAGSTDAWTPVGTTIRARPESFLLYVDAAAAPGGTGATPTDPFDKLDDALLAAAALAFGGLRSNVLVMEGTYTTRPFDPIPQTGGAFTVGPDVHCYGGFKPGFDFADRDATGGGTVLHDGGTTTILDLVSGGPIRVIDGFVIDGLDAATEGIDVTESDCEFRSVVARGCVDNGMRIRQQLDVENQRHVSLVACDISQNGSDGVGVAGNFDVVFDRSTFDANGGAGLDANDLLALSGGTATLRAFGCRFFGNSLEGLRADLNTITTSPQTPGGLFRISIEGCTFQRNGLDGLFIDQDYDLFPAWRVELTVQDCVSRANGLAGIHFDADDQGQFSIDRTSCTANGSDGMQIASEPDDPTPDDDLAPGMVTVTNCYLGGNLGIGIHTIEGDKVVLASHTVLAGNRGGGFVSETTAPRGNNSRRIGSAVNCIVWRQPTPFVNVQTESCFVEDTTNPFNVAPSAFGVAVAEADGVLTLSANTSIGPGDAAEVADDGVKLTVTGAGGGTLTVTPAPGTFVGPDAVFGFPFASVASVIEDLRLQPDTAAIGTGLAPADLAPIDPGPLGSIGGGQPGTFDPFRTTVLRLVQTSPPIPTGVDPTTPMVLTFDRQLDALSLDPDRIRVPGLPGIQWSASGNQLTVSPPPGGWTGTNVIEVNIGITAEDGTLFGTPLLVPVLVR